MTPVESARALLASFTSNTASAIGAGAIGIGIGSILPRMPWMAKRFSHSRDRNPRRWHGPDSSRRREGGSDPSILVSDNYLALLDNSRRARSLRLISVHNLTSIIEDHGNGNKIV